jgi:hypothetical protein
MLQAMYETGERIEFMDPVHSPLLPNLGKEWNADSFKYCLDIL